ncbi:hypothetical protein [Brevibacillus laterosporus]|uniref:hypothetical protein n=1 Tax=Brevibacillus laterosporus TaxID=1465 RepID=UPI002E1CEF68|nr:hypothetical protein [Brevibacillus laterosporus]MED1667145.1 hypothetical protein [Brevibacillus laterosporus]MED1719787.1 hypothetical protein [Brevibacillus laterosporus]
MSIKKVNNKEKEKIECLKCVKKRVASSFYVNTNPLLTTKKFIVCKDCLNEYIGEKETEGYFERVIHVLSMLDKPFFYDQWENLEGDWSKYIPPISSFPQYKGKTFADSVFSQTANNSFESSLEPNPEFTKIEFSSDELQSLIDFWGRGFKNEDYEFLQNEFNRFINSYECDGYTMELLFQEASHTRLTIKRKREKNQPVDKELKTLQDLLGSANIKPVQETGANATEHATFGTLIKKYENERPIPEPDPTWRDVDSIRKYINIWFLGHLCKMIGIKNEYSIAYDEEMEKYTAEPPKFEDDETNEGDQ